MVLKEVSLPSLHSKQLRLQWALRQTLRYPARHEIVHSKMNHLITVPYSQGTQEVPLDQHGYPEQLKNGGLGKIKAKHIQGISSMVHDENMARRADYLEEAETGIQADVAGAVNITDDPTIGLSAGSDPISEGRRIYIGTPPCLLEGGVTNCVYGAEANCNVERCAGGHESVRGQAQRSGPHEGTSSTP
jgi:hypothetical protein